MNSATDDITKNRHKGNEASNAAFAKIKSSKSEWWDKIVAFGMRHSTFTAKEFAESHGKALNEISGRISEAKEMGLIAETKEPRRRGCTVLRVIKFA